MMALDRTPHFFLALAAIAVMGLGLPAEARGTDPEAPETTAEAPAEAEASRGKVTAVATTDLERQLLERARSYWDARVARSADVYSFYPPREAREKAHVPREFVGMGYGGFTIERVVVDKNGERAVIVVAPEPELSRKLEAQLRGFDYHEHLSTPTGEEWIRYEGEWYKKPIYGGLSRFMKWRKDAAKQKNEADAAQGAVQKGEGEAKGDTL